MPLDPGFAEEPQAVRSAGVLMPADRQEGSRYVLGTFFSLALVVDGLGLVAMGIGGRRVMSMVTEEQEQEQEAQSSRENPDKSAETIDPGKRAEGGFDQSHN